MNKLLVLASLVVALVGCASRLQPLESRLIIKHAGWFYNNCLAIKLPNLPKGKIVTLVDAEDTENTLRSQIIDLASSSDGCPPLAEDRKNVNTESGNIFYLISKPKEIRAEGKFNFGFAVVLGDRKELTSDVKILDLNNDGMRDTFSFCATSEGISFEVWSAKPYKSKSIWNGYYYLGYDIESNCPER